MPKKQKRDKAYYRERLKREHPTIYADLKAGRHRTVTDAAICAGLKKPRTRLHELKNAWSKAGSAERSDFLAWLAATGVLPATASSTATTSTCIATGRYLLPTTIARINYIKAKRDMSAGDIMGEMGFTKLDPSLGLALSKGYGLRLSVIAALEAWLEKNKTV